MFAFFAISFSSSFEACYVYINTTEEIFPEYPKNRSQKSKLLAVFFVDDGLNVFFPFKLIIISFYFTFFGLHVAIVF